MLGAISTVYGPRKCCLVQSHFSILARESPFPERKLELESALRSHLKGYVSAENELIDAVFVIIGCAEKSSQKCIRFILQALREVWRRLYHSTIKDMGNGCIGISGNSIPL